MKNFFTFILAVLICESAGIAGSFFTTSAINSWYAGINKPYFSPPNWIFAPVWTALFFLMGISLYSLWKERNRPEAKKGLILFSLQLILNVWWSVLFFGLQNLFLAFIEIIFLWFAILAATLQLKKVGREAYLPFLPYLLWVSFAAFLNFSVWQLNM